MAYDLTNATTLSGLINQNLPRRPWLFRKFFTPKYHDTLQIAVDIVSGTKKLAPFRREGEESTVKSSIGTTTKFFGPNQISIKNLTKAFDLKKRAAGQQFSYGDGVKTVEDRIAFKLGQELTDMTNRIYQTIEKMCAEALYNDEVNNYDANGNVIETFSIGLADDHKVTRTSSAAWNQSGATILEDIDDWCDIVETDSALPATDVILGAGAKNALRSNDKVLKQLSTNTAKFALIDPQKKEAGGQFLGYTSDGVRLWCCTETYENSAGSKTAMIPDDKVIVLSNEMAANVHFGLIEDIEAGGFVGEIFSKTWETKDPSGIWLKAASAPLALVSQPSALVVADVM